VVVGTARLERDSVPIGHIKFKLNVLDRQPERGLAARKFALCGMDAVRYTRAFVSYASADRAKVLARVQALRAMSIECFQDVLDLNPGERWERKLYAKIDECDVFLLFWSGFAKNSEWVRKEARYALDRKAGSELRPPEIRPVIIEGPPVPVPWEELAHLHFNDPIANLIQ
jgi:hypothetical protein